MTATIKTPEGDVYLELKGNVLFAFAGGEAAETQYATKHCSASSDPGWVVYLTEHWLFVRVAGDRLHAELHRGQNPV